MPVETLKWENGRLCYIDQTQLPTILVEHVTADYRVVAEAIRRLEIRGAPAIGIAAAFGVVLGMQELLTASGGNPIELGEQIITELESTRPTAVNLFWALERMRTVLRSHRENNKSIIDTLLAEALAIWEEDREICRALGRNGAELIRDGDTILTHCNAGALATADYGTALGVIYSAAKQGKNIHVYVDETRPLLQGARLTAWELMQEKIDVTLICDNMAASLMQQGKIDAIFVGADRIAQNGDTANKIGTYNLAVLANYHRIPMNIVAPLSTVDVDITDGSAIPVEERHAEEVTKIRNHRIAPAGVKVYNPAFDVTPHSLITSIVTEKGIVRPPYREKLIKIKNKS